MINTRVLKSALDRSVNWISNYGKGSIETRFVRKTDPYFIAYVSSHSGCKMGCKQCFLTQQNQITFDHVTPEVYGEQLQLVLDHYKDVVGEGELTASRVNINFMARGEPLANKHVVRGYGEIYEQFVVRSGKANVRPKVNISTIFPRAAVHYNLTKMLGNTSTHLYYSLYSVEPKFREHWMPGAAPVERALNSLKEYEETAISRGVEYPVTFHWAVIKNHNDNIYWVKETAKLIRAYGFKSKFNLVRYNAHENTNTEEPNDERLSEIFNIISDAAGSTRSYIVPRVGKDISASCGMFIDDN